MYSLVKGGTFILWLYSVCSVTFTSDLTRSKTIRQLIWDMNRLRQAADLIQEHGLSSYYDQPNITVFVPASEFFLTFDSSKFGYNMRDRNSVMNLMLYHIGNGQIVKKVIKNGQTITTKHPLRYNLMLNIFHDGESTIYTVNGASLIVTDIVGSNGVLHIIDKVIAPVSSSKTLHDYLIVPDIPNINFTSISRASIVDMNLKIKTNMPEYTFTAFSPPDSVLVPMPKYGQDRLFGNLTLLNNTIHAHIVPDKISFLPTTGDIHDMHSKHGVLHFSREGQHIYVENNRVRARITQPNIPVANGVIHVIDNILYFVYMNVVQKISSMKSTSIFSAHVNRIPTHQLSHLQDPSEVFTFFAPTNDAFAKVPHSKQQLIAQDEKTRSEVLGTHIVKGLDVDSSKLYDGRTIRTINNSTLAVRKINGDTYIQNGVTLAKIERSNIGCLNGVVHTVSSVFQLNHFTVLDAIRGINQLSKINTLLKKFVDLERIIDGENGLSSRMTVFMPSDAAIADIPSDVWNSMVNDNPASVLDALKGHIIEGESIPSTAVLNIMTKYTYGGQKIHLSNHNQGFIVMGTHIEADVVTSDIWCSNGVLHIIDNILHIPTRTIIDETKRHKDISSISALLHLEGMKELSHALADNKSQFTLFIPTNDVFDSIPRSRADILLTNATLLENVLKAHVTGTGGHYSAQLYDGTSFKAEEEYIHVSRNAMKVDVINNNVRARVTRSNIPATNGVIHIINKLLFFPYFVVAEVMFDNPDLRPFYDLMKNLPAFLNLAQDETKEITVFAPSSKYLNSLPRSDLERISADPDVLRKIFIGHVIPNGTLDSRHIRQNLRQKYSYKSQYGVSFTVEKTSTVSGSTIDTGYTNLKYEIDINRDGVACSNGIVYIIDGFLDFTFKNIIDEMKTQEKLKFSLENIMGIFPTGVENEFTDSRNLFTVFMPANEAFLYLSQPEISYLYNISNTSEKYELLRRHTVNGTVMDIDKIRMLCLHVTTECILSDMVTVREHSDTGLFLEWNGVQSKIIQSNILANNGIIHIIDRILFKVEEETTTKFPRTGGVSCGSLKCCSFVNLLILFIIYALC